MRLPFGRVDQPPVSLSARKDGRRFTWLGLLLVGLGTAAIVISLFISHQAVGSTNPLSEPELVQAVTNAGVQASPEGLTVAAGATSRPAGDCPT